MINAPQTYAIIDKKKKVLETCRSKATAIRMLNQLQKNYYEKLEIIKSK